MVQASELDFRLQRVRAGQSVSAEHAVVPSWQRLFVHVRDEAKQQVKKPALLKGVCEIADTALCSGPRC
jgi:hypothetical protein